MTWIYFWSVHGAETETSLDSSSSLLTGLMTLTDVETVFDAAVHWLGKNQFVVKNPARSREGVVDVDVSHDFCLRVMMTWTDVGTQNFDKVWCCAGVR